MAALQKKHIQGTLEGPSYQKTTDLLFDKVFGNQRKFSHDFATDLGVVVIKGFTITYDDKDVIKYTKNAQRETYLEYAPQAQNIVFHGTKKGSRKSIELKLSQLIKTEEFGGKPVGGAKESKGTIFEKEFTTRLKECINGQVCKGKYHQSAGYLVAKLEEINGPIISVENVGGQNASRPFEVSGEQPYISPKAHKNHGPVLTDVTVIHKDNKKSYLSLKFGGTLTFMNPGSKTLFTDEDIKNYDIEKEKGKALLNMFNIDPMQFCLVFNKFGTKAQVARNKKESGAPRGVNTDIIQKFVRTAMGSNYWMIHAHDSGELVDMWWMEPSDVSSKYSTVRDVMVYYGGKGSDGKRVDVTFSNTFFKFSLNIRNKGGGVYPTNVMLDYKTLSIPTKVTL